MDLGVVLTDVTAFAGTTLTGFGTIISASLGLAMAFYAIRKFVKR